MFTAGKFVKPLIAAFVLTLGLSAAAVAAEEAAAGPQPHMMYFYNPSCRLCTETNEVISMVEEKYKDRATFQRLDIADPETGTDDVLYMFDLMDELKLPETDNTTLIVFIGLLETIDGEVYFTPKRALVDGEEIMKKLDAAMTDFLANEGKVAAAVPVSAAPVASAPEGGSFGAELRADFFFQRTGLCLGHSARG